MERALEFLQKIMQDIMMSSKMHKLVKYLSTLDLYSIKIYRYKDGRKVEKGKFYHS